MAIKPINCAGSKVGEGLTLAYRTLRVEIVGIDYQSCPQVRRGGDAASVVRDMVGSDPREHFIAIYLDTRHRVLAAHVVSIGSMDGVTVHPREVFAPALLCGASAIIVAHNHPSGDPTASPEDRKVTERLRQCGETLGIEVLDHIVIGSSRYFSFAEDAFFSCQ